MLFPGSGFQSGRLKLSYQASAMHVCWVHRDHGTVIQNTTCMNQRPPLEPVRNAYVRLKKLTRR